jgi:hypothetical protein
MTMTNRLRLGLCIAAGLMCAAAVGPRQAEAQLTRPAKPPKPSTGPATAPTPASGPTAEEALAVFNSLYGEEYNRVLAAKDTDGEIALANKLYAAAISSKDQPTLLAVLCEKIWELACKDGAGLRLILDSERLLARTAPALHQASSEKLLDALQKAYASAKGPQHSEAGEALINVLEERADTRSKADPNTAADLLRKAVTVALAIGSTSKDDLQAKLAVLTARQKTLSQIDALGAILAAKPQDKATREKIINLYLVDLDDPAGAAKAVNEDCEESLRTYLPLAAGKVDALAEEACLELAGWYESLAKKYTGGKLTLLLRAKGYYEQYLRKHKAQDLSAKKAELTLKDLKETLVKLNPALAVGRPVFADKAMGDVFERGVRFLWAAQKEDGSWKAQPGDPPLPTALICVGMMESGCGARDAHLNKALKWLSAQKTNQTYVLGLRSQCWALGALSSPGSFGDELKKDVELLITGTTDGSWNSYCYPGSRTRDGDAVSSQYGLLGLWAGANGKLPIPKKYWEMALGFWTGRQNSDGGWGNYPRDWSHAPSTAAGLLCLLMCQEQLGQARETSLELPAVKSAIAYLEKNHQGMLNNQDPFGEQHLYLYLLGRAGTQAGTTTLGKLEWFKSGCDALKKQQKSDGSWDGRDGAEMSTAQAILFLAAGAQIPPK